MNHFLLSSRMLAKSICGTAIAVVLCGAASAARAQDAPAKPEPDVIVFKNGDQLTGKLEKGTGNSITFKSDMAGEITVSLDKVKELHSHESFAVLKKDEKLTRKNLKQTVAPGTVSYADGKVQVEPPAGTSSSVDEGNVAFIIDQPTFDKQMVRAKLWQGWNGSATAGLTDVQATNYGTTFNLGLGLIRALPTVSYLPPRSKSIVNVLETYGKLTSPVIPQPDPTHPLPDAVAKTSIFHADAEQDEYFTPRFYALGDTSFDHNYGQGLNLQQLYGGGVGWTPIMNAKQQLDVRGDVHYEKQQFFMPSSNQNLIGSTISEAYRRTLPAKIQLTESASILPAFNNSNAYSGTGNLNLILPAYKRLAVNLGLSDNFINDPSPGYQKNSFQFITGLAYTFH